MSGGLALLGLAIVIGSQAASRAFASWNQTAAWLRQLEALREVA